ncbi:NAD(P)H-binding protein [Nonomuraea lactucae]|uniref:NAD(P)H-binding protein n=1 Tax=Nonomuraea lactucae TaxID=2249762 RepID=UPI001F05267C|nr:NAD(P)H-binding protein [Nonomuraea lactucae]
MAPDSPAPGGPESGGSAPGEVRHRRADLAEPGSLRGVLDGAEALFLLVAGEDPVGVLDLAAESGVRRVVLLSSVGAATRPRAYRHPAAFEDAVRRSGLAWTILRPGGFASNAFAWADDIRARRTVTAPFGDVGLPVVDPADIAEVAAVTLRGAGHSGRAYELTGPAPISPREQAAAIGEALGEAVRFDGQTREEARERMLRFMPEPVVEATLAVLGEPTAAEQKVSPDVEHLLGRPPRAFADWTARNIAAFR